MGCLLLVWLIVVCLILAFIASGKGPDEESKATEIAPEPPDSDFQD